MSEIRNFLKNSLLGEAIHFEGLIMFPLFAEPGACIDYLTLDEALAAGVLDIGEVSDSGSVPELSLKNTSNEPVLLLDGEELVGAKQNRVLNLSFLAPAGSSTVIPVSCVEAGRWSFKSNHFKAAGRTQYARGRARKTAQVSESLQSRGSRHSDQSAVWDDISLKAACMDVDSETGAMADIYTRYDTDIDDYVKALMPRPGQTGALFVIGERVVGCDVFDRPETLQKNLAKLVRGCALDALELRSPEGSPSSEPVASDLVESFLAALSDAKVDYYEALGLGTDLRLHGEGVTGAALVVEGCLVHLCAFAEPNDGASPRRHTDGLDVLY